MRSLARLLVKFFIAMIMAIVLLGITSPQVFGQSSIHGLIVDQQDLDSDGQLELTVINSAFATQRDRILVYDFTGDMQASSDVASAVDLNNDTWIFDVGSNGDAQLIVVFVEEYQRKMARVYDDVNNDGFVSFEVNNANLIVTESPSWHVQVSSQSGWEVGNELLNPNLEILIDGYVLRYIKWGELFPASDWGFDKIKTDGTIDWEIQIADSDGDGVADFQLQRLQVDIPWNYPVFRSTLYVNKGKKQSTPNPDTIFWPMLVGKHNYEKYNYFDHPAVVAIDWKSAKIDRVGILGYPIENGYHINSRVGVWKDNQINYADFENPMAYYDMAKDNDGRPELFVRFEVFRANDPLFNWGYGMGEFPKPITQVEYTWDQNNDGKWDFELGLGGFNPVTSTASVGDLQILTVPYQDVPIWTSEQEWNIAVLVATESQAYWSSEGLAEWSIDRGFANGKLVEPSGLRNLYLTGITDNPPIEKYSELPIGMRGELSYRFNDKPFVYLSAIDGKLHLLHADRGIWQISGTAQVRYENLNNDLYLDQWQFWEDNTLTRQMVNIEDYLLYSDNSQVILTSFPESPASFVLPPPRSFEEWQNLEEKIQNKQSIIKAGDFLSLINSFNEPKQKLMGAVLRDYRPAGDGFRFVLNLSSNFTLNGPDLMGLLGKAPGDYVIDYRGKFNIQPLTPPALKIRILKSNMAGESIKALQNEDMQVNIINYGLEDAHFVKAQATFTSPDQKVTVSQPQTIAVLAGETTSVSFPWGPTASGAWSARVEAQVMDDEGEPGETQSAVQQILVAPADQVTDDQALTAFGLVPDWTVPLLLAVIALMAGALVWGLRESES